LIIPNLEGFLLRLADNKKSFKCTKADDLKIIIKGLQNIVTLNKDERLFMLKLSYSNKYLSQYKFK